MDDHALKQPEKDYGRHRSSSKHISRHHSHDSKHKLGQAKDFKNDGRHRQESKNQQPELKKNDPFLSDRKGDPGIVKFGSNHAYDVPNYRRIGYGRVVGLPMSFKIDREKTSDKEIYIITSDSSGSKRNKSIFAKVAGQEEYHVREVATTFSDDLDKNYLTLNGRLDNDAEDGGENPNALKEDESTHYRSITGKAKQGLPDDGDLVPPVSTSAAPPHESDRQQESLQAKVDRNPTSSQAWLALIQHRFRNASDGTYAERISNAEIRISMYEKALKHVEDQELLLAGLLKEATLIWDTQKLQRKWKDALKQYLHSFNLRKHYLDYVQTTSNRFRFDDLRNIYQECIHDFSTVLSREVPPAQKQRQIRQILYFLVRWTICLRQAGYQEQAIAIWQMTLEVQLSRSPITQEQYEAFWDSEVPRIGEANALGIDHWTSNGDEAPVEIRDPPVPQESSIREWSQYEDTLSKQLPARTLDDTAGEDPFRIVLFSDIQSFWLDLPKATIDVALDAFLLFCGLPSIQNHTTELSSDDIFLHASSRTQQQGALHGSTSGQFSSCLLTEDVLFDSDWLFSMDQLSTDSDFIRHVLRFCMEQDFKLGRPRLLQYYLAFELKFDPNEARKFSKSLVKKHSQNLLLYNNHALIEYSMGNRTAAEKILLTAISMRQNDSEIILLRRTLTWKTLEAQDPDIALNHLLGNASAHDATAIFAIQQELLRKRDEVIGKQDMEHLLLAYIECLVLLSYLTNPEPLDAALAIFESNLVFLQYRRSSDHLVIVELLHQSLARLLRYHMQNKRYKPSTIRKAIQKGIEAYPTNTIFLSLLQENERRFRFNDRVRSVVSDILTTREGPTTGTPSSPLITRLFSIEVELSRSTELGTSTSSIRSAFERALDDPNTRNSPALWHSYIEFERSRMDHDDRLGDVLLRSIAACPWNRQFYLKAIQHWSSDTVKAKSIYELMIERELRLHMSLTEDD